MPNKAIQLTAESVVRFGRIPFKVSKIAMPDKIMFSSDESSLSMEEQEESSEPEAHVANVPGLIKRADSPDSELELTATIKRHIETHQDS